MTGDRDSQNNRMKKQATSSNKMREDERRGAREIFHDRRLCSKLNTVQTCDCQTAVTCHST